MSHNKRIESAKRRLAKRKRTGDPCQVVLAATMPDGSPGYRLSDGRIVNRAEYEHIFEDVHARGDFVIIVNR